MKKLEECVRSMPDFPEPGIIFRDVTNTFQDADGLHLAVDSLIHMVEDLNYGVVIGSESKGFIFGVSVAYTQHKSFVSVHKQDKLPCEIISVGYELEYGTATIEIHEDVIKPGQRVMIVDDLIATGGTTEAIIKLIEQLGGVVVGVCLIMELAGLDGQEHLKGYDVGSVIIYKGG